MSRRPRRPPAPSAAAPLASPFSRAPRRRAPPLKMAARARRTAVPGRSRRHLVARGGGGRHDSPHPRASRRRCRRRRRRPSPAARTGSAVPGAVARGRAALRPARRGAPVRPCAARRAPAGGRPVPWARRRATVLVLS